MNTQEEQYIIDESQELSFGWTEKFFSAFPALRHRNYKLYFVGQMLSLIGTWIQMVALGWLVFQLTQSAFMVGLVAALGSLPVLIFSLFGGILVDRYQKKMLLLITQSAEMILAAVLAYLTLTGMITVHHIAFLSILLGIVTALDMPARQAFTFEMVGKEDLSSAIALNAGTYNGARVIGPAIAGILIGLFGAGIAFLLNSISFIAVIIALSFIKTSVKLPESHPRPMQAIKDGFSYAFSHAIIKTVLIFAAVASIFGWSHAILMPVIVDTVFHANATILGTFFAAQGFGAVISTLIASYYSKKTSSVNLVLVGSFLFCVAIILFATFPFLPLSYVFLFFMGFGLVMTFSMLITTLQHLVEDNLRGRIMSIFTVMFLGMQPVGNFLMGFLAENIGSRNALIIGGVVMALFTYHLFLKRKILIEQYRLHIESLD